MDTAVNIELLKNKLITELYENGDVILCGETLTFDEVLKHAMDYGDLGENLCNLLYDPEYSKNSFPIYKSMEKALVEIIKERVACTTPY